MYDGKKLCAYRGDWVFQNAKSLDNIGRGDRDTIKGAIEVEFDESFLLWHIATNLCFHSNDQKQDLDDCKDYRDTSHTTKNGGFGPRFFGPRFKKCSPKMPNKREGPAAFLKRGLSPGLRPRF